MWIAKNDITGKTYGEPFESIYDCQKYIDTKLVILQYEWRRIAYLEEDQINEEKYEKWSKERYGKDKSIITEIYGKIEYAIHTMAENKYRSQNVIRCWIVEQKRYAEGMDF